ncbi:M28 family metallopeptidase [Natronosalvus rutilus]|uniref:Carboxypeptidase Q n=1 Tax=Natronosalvus rutilus TaxID=2953753 RepID=A0A9E7SU62_9EURY|nr:M28 family metallopeptidase [Natronosalvus rutilus]UTF53200.1 M28 family metallopeptidase [Natronosalvus rutilus]
MTTPTDPDDSSRLERTLGRAWSDDRPWELLTALTQLESRMGGSPGERAAADLVAEAFERVGVANVGLESFPIQYWERGKTTFTVTEPVEREFEALALPYAPAADLEAPLVDVGYGTPEEIDDAGEAVEGAIVVASTTTPAGQRFVHRMEKFGHAVDAGARGFVFANHVPGQLPPTGALRFDREAAIPGIGVSAETHDWLTEYANSPAADPDESANARASLRVEATTTDGSSQNVVGTLGPDTDDELLLLAHYDAHDVAEGALDNGCGVATVLGAASVLAAVESDLGCRVRVAAVGCEEIGLLGAEALAERLDLESVRAVVNVDGAGRFRNLQAYSHASEEMRALATEVGEHYGQPVVHEPDPHPFSDHWPFLRAGVPALQLHSEPAGGGERGRGWGHTAADSRDKVDVRNIRTHTMLSAVLVRVLSRRTPPRIDGADLRDAFREQHYEPGMRASDTWPRAWD